ncbi:LuxR C-terminal-related transcriptional regulator, partial [Oscillochloris sp. ZM17-4]|uniref:LuxR C-terminal-related transcriptional regulator n=1 Tax=Oscillochloris sp. ZM17-4 TaxID=2866714 RepID=UPI001C72A28C
SREDPPLPLARLRARDQLSELRLADLRFTRSEAAAFFTHTMGLSLTADAIAALEARTEGWVAGLQLAALSLQRQSDSDSFIASFTGSHHLVLDYLVEEVLHQQPAPLQQFLLRTSILDRLCGPLCDAVLGDSATPGQATLEALERANLFLIPLDNERRWYRYHHLFADMLRQRAGGSAGGDIAALHQRASAWYEAQGFELDAIPHAAAANDPARLARLAERLWQEMDRNFQMATWIGWVRQVPDAIIRARPVLSTEYAWALMDLGDMEACDARLRDAERCLELTAADSAPPEPADAMLPNLPGMIAFARAYIAQSHGDTAAAARYAQLAINRAPESNPVLRAQATVILGTTAWVNGDLDAAFQAFSDWVQHMRQAGNLAFAMAGVFGLIEIRATQGRLHDAARAYQQALKLAPDGALDTAYLDVSVALLRLEMGEREEAARYLEQSGQRLDQSPFIDLPFRWHLAQARLKEAEGDHEAALDLIDEAGRRYVRTPVPDVRPIDAIAARAQLRAGRLDNALDWARASGLGAADDLSYLREFAHLTLARVRIAEYAHRRAADALDDALALLARLLAAAEAGGRNGSVIEILIVQALAHAARGDERPALAPLRRALALAAPEGYCQIFLDEGPPLARLLATALAEGSEPAYVRRLLAAFAAAAPVPEASASDPDTPEVEPLSEREREVLGLIAEGLTNQDVADRLYLSPHTVKVHTRNIYAKLGVASRTQAVARARALGLLAHE